MLRTDALIRLGYHILFGKVGPATFDPDWNYERVIPNFEPVSELEKILNAPYLATALERLTPSHPLYVRLRDALASYRRIRDSGGWPRLPEGDAIRPGGSNPRVPAPLERLAITGDISPAEGEDASLACGERLVAAVRRFQAGHGLREDGIAGRRTIEEMNVPVQERIDQLRVKIEYGRWLLQDLGQTLVAVNVAGYRLHVFRDGAIEWETRVQVGRPNRPTPVFRSEITYLVLNPTWTVPPGILRKEIIPAHRCDPATIGRMRLRVFDTAGDEIDPSEVDWPSRWIPYTLRRDPGPTNALGRVQFMFPNPHMVYLHDTASKELFGEEDRAFSHGCVRVLVPIVLAEQLLGGQPGGSRGEIDNAVASGETQTVTLERPVPVLITYWTAWVEEDRALHLRHDVYGRDKKALEGLRSVFRFRAGVLA